MQRVRSHTFLMWARVVRSWHQNRMASTDMTRNFTSSSNVPQPPDLTAGPFLVHGPPSVTAGLRHGCRRLCSARAWFGLAQTSLLCSCSISYSICPAYTFDTLLCLSEQLRLRCLYTPATPIQPTIPNPENPKPSYPIPSCSTATRDCAVLCCIMRLT